MENKMWTIAFFFAGGDERDKKFYLLVFSCPMYLSKWKNPVQKILLCNSGSITSLKYHHFLLPIQAFFISKRKISNANYGTAIWETCNRETKLNRLLT